MNARIATLAATALLVGGAAAVPPASAHNSFAVSIGLPGLAVGYSNRGVGIVAAAPVFYPPAYYAPALTYAAPVYYPAAPAYYATPAYYPAPVVYSAPIVVSQAYYAPAYRPYYRPYYRPANVVYRGRY